MLKANQPSGRVSFFSRVMRWLPTGTRGKARLARRLFGVGLDEKDVSIKSGQGHSYILPNLRGALAFHLLIDGIYEVDEIDFIINQLPIGGVLADVGANVGVYTIPAAQKVGPSGRILAFEASPRIFPYLQRNLELNAITNVLPLNSAVFHCDGESLPFYDPPTENFGMGALAEQFDVEPVYVPAFTLDTMLRENGIEQVDVMKVDVEGFEASVFEGARELLTGANPPIIAFEFCDWAEERAPNRKLGDAQRVLLGYGYKLWLMADFLAGRAPMDRILMSGFETIIAKRDS